MTLQEAMLERLLPRYERAGLKEPPFRSADVDEALAFVKQQLDGVHQEQRPPRHH